MDEKELEKLSNEELFKIVTNKESDKRDIDIAESLLKKRDAYKDIFRGPIDILGVIEEAKKTGNWRNVIILILVVLILSYLIFGMGILKDFWIFK